MTECTSYVIRRLEEYFVQSASVLPLKLRLDEKYQKPAAAIQIDVSSDPRRNSWGSGPVLVPGTELRVVVPFEGDPGVWAFRPAILHSDGAPDIEVKGNELEIRLRFVDDSADPDRLRSNLSSELTKLRQIAGRKSQDIEDHNRDVRKVVESALRSKRSIAQTAVGVVASLGIPVRRAGEKPDIAFPVRRRRAPDARQKPEPSRGGFEPEPELPEGEYQHILGVMRSMALASERSPQAFAQMKEETIRDILLVQLNAHYEGSATGETFSRGGKTDVLVRIDGRHVFIAECKVWGGQRKFGKAIDQLLGYLTWRDSKAALLVFSRQADVQAVGDKMHQVMLSRAEFVRTEKHDPAGDSRYVLVNAKKAPGRQIIVTTQVYDVSLPCE